MILLTGARPRVRPGGVRMGIARVGMQNSNLVGINRGSSSSPENSQELPSGVRHGYFSSARCWNSFLHRESANWNRNTGRY